MLEELIQITAPDGTLIVSSNAANYKEKNFKQDIAQSFKNSHCDYLKAFIIKKLTK